MTLAVLSQSERPSPRNAWLKVTRPHPNEVEITIFGRGVGECLVVHAGGDWIVIDSHLDRRQPIALRYLHDLDVDPADVKVLVVTHFHADHYWGIDRLHDACPNARLMVTEALQAKEFEQLYGDDGEEPLLGMIPTTIRRARRRTLPGGSPGFRALKVGAPVHNNQAANISALSPSEAAVQASCHEIAMAMSSSDHFVVANQLKDDNRCAVVLHVDCGDFSALLTADLVNDGAGLGWSALLGEPLIEGTSTSDLVKVPHHGSEGADHPEMWTRFVTPDPCLAVTPFWPSSIPTEDDVTRLRGYGRLWQAAPSTGAAEDEFGNVVSAAPVTGRITARRKPGEAAWRIETSGAAFEVV